ncbi:MAG: heavy metal translocating P-type ATPase, partial [Clostridia bacterium]|nr:heavy metal translocating P-type ATPase [Clostridia bacterium]
VLSNIIRMVEEAQSSKANIQTVADKVSAIFVPTVTLIAVITFIVTFFVTNELVNALDNAVAVLVIACPCSLGLATPTALMVGIGRGASMGILIKNADALEQACKIKALVLDKTGTVTEGKPSVTELITLGEMSEKEALCYAASVEALSEHPIAKAIVSAYDGDLLECSDFETVTGYGVRAKVNGKSVTVGKASWIESCLGIKIETKHNPNTLSVVAVDEYAVLMISVSDTVRVESKDAVSKLKSLGIKTYLVTGDNEFSAKAVAKSVGVDGYISDVLPEGKVNAVNEYKVKHGVTAMVGDGINDAPALAVANVGFAVGNGSDIAIESGDIVLINGGISAVADSILLSRATMKKIKQNLFWAFFYNTVGIPLAAFGLLSPIIAGAAMAFSSVSVVTNSLLLKRVKLK